MTLRSILIMPAILALLTPLQAQNPEFDWNVLHRRVADLLQHGFTDEAETVLQDAIRAADEMTRAKVSRRPSMISGLYVTIPGGVVDADRAYRESLSIWRRVDATNPKLAITLGNLAGLRLAQGRPSDAEKLYLEAQHLLLQPMGPKIRRSPVFSRVWLMSIGRRENITKRGCSPSVRFPFWTAQGTIRNWGQRFHPRKDCLERE